MFSVTPLCLNKTQNMCTYITAYWDYNSMKRPAIWGVDIYMDNLKMASCQISHREFTCKQRSVMIDVSGLGMSFLNTLCLKLQVTFQSTKSVKNLDPYWCFTREPDSDRSAVLRMWMKAAEEVAEALRLRWDSSEIKQEDCAPANCLPLGTSRFCFQF